MMNFVKNFKNDECGAVTVDWVVLTAAVVGLAIAAYGSIRDGAQDMTAQTGDFLGAQTVGTATFGSTLP
jgi:Flp pilus assembly pilin Flp